MIPRSLKLENFLSFGPEQTLAFEKDKVYLLGGNNGVGKSSVFDAILFALFNGHRAGQKDHLHELVHKGKDVGKVVFDFELDGRFFRAQRTVQRKFDSRTKQARAQTDAVLFEWQGEGAGWKPIPGTQKQDGFKKWIDENIGLRFETFTAAVLLMQNRAEQLVSNEADSARQRFEVLARVVGLDWYARLHAEAESRRKKAVVEADSRAAERDRIAQVTDEDFAAAARLVSSAESRLAGADGEIRELTSRRDRAADWWRVSRQRAERSGALVEAERLVDESVGIERDGRRAAELAANLPEAEVYFAQETERGAAASRIAEIDDRLRAAAGESQRVGTGIEEAAARDTALATEEKELSTRAAAGERDKQVLDLAVRLLQRLDRERGQFLKKAAEADAARGRLGGREDRIKALSAALRDVKVTEETARRAAAEALNRLSAARATETQEKGGLERFRSVAGDQTCRYCGHPLTAEHVLTELARLEGDCSGRERERRAAEHEATRADEALATVAARRKELEDEHASALDEQRHLNHEIALAAQAAGLHSGRCEDTRTELPEPYRSRVSPTPVSDWTQVPYPDADGWAAIREEQVGAAARLRETTESLKKVRETRTSDADTVRALRGRAEKLREEQERVRVELAEQQSRAGAAVGRRDDALRRLSATWATAVHGVGGDDLRRWRGEWNELRSRNAADRWAALQHARAALDPLREECERLRTEEEAFLPEERRNPADVAAELADANTRLGNLQRERAAAESQCDALRARRERREEATTHALAADRQRHLWGRLADYLGRKKLQRHLLRQAEHQIVEQANRLLDRLTGGALTLRLQGGDGDDDRALELEATKAATSQSFALSFLSGSERFRVAVALALALGQYGCQRRRPIESVIIDEGFGCLDRTNRQSMIDELGALREQLRCVILVSHQEEFAEAFPDGYHFRLVEGATCVTPTHG